jgi:hypothetical protein
MLMVGAGLMIAAIAAFLAWNGVRKCQERWHERNASRLLAEKKRAP